jgi:hypothetical protein
MRALGQAKYKQLGCMWGKNSNIQERAWLQFADEAITIASSDKNAQTLMNVFVAWCSWAGMKIRIDKCHSFGMRKENDIYRQYLPAISSGVDQIRAVPIGESFTYLGKLFNSNMNKDEAKAQLLSKLDKLLLKLSSLAIKPQLKLRILKFVIFPKISFELKIYDFALTWINNSLDSVIHSHIRRWLELPISSCSQEIASLPTKMCGFDIPSLRTYATHSRLTVRSGLKNSANSDIRQLWQETSVKNILIDSALNKSNSLLSAKKCITLEARNVAMKHIETIELQGRSISSIIDNINKAKICQWSNSLQLLPATLFCFVRKALIQQLPTMSNLYRWGKNLVNQCPLCGQTQTNKHVLSNCSAPVALQRYKTRHDAILYIVCNWMKSVMSADSVLFADIGGYRPLGEIFEKLRPDIAVVKADVIYLCELTICHETNLRKSKDFKLNKYCNIESDLKSEYSAFKLELHSLEMSVLGFMSDFSNFTKAVSIDLLPETVHPNLIRNVISNSYNIYLNRNNADLCLTVRSNTNDNPT